MPPTAHATTSVLTVGAIASAGAAILHGAAAGIHAEHVGLSRIFVVLAIAQGAAAVLAFVRVGSAAAATLAGVNTAAIVGWLVTRLFGVSAIGGLEMAERPQPADTIAAALALIAVAAAVGHATGRSPAVGGRSLAMSSLIAGVLVVPGLADATGHQHADTGSSAEHDHDGDHDDPSDASSGGATDAAAAAAAGGGDTGARDTDHADTDHTDDHDTDTTHTDDHDTDHTDDHDTDTAAAGDEHDGHESSATPPVPYDPDLPIDLGGVEGVTLQQQAFAENLVAATVRDLPQWSDPAVAEAAGFRSIGDGATGHEHFIQWEWIDDDVWLDPDAPESLVYEPQPDGTRRLVSAMYMLPSDTALEDVPDWGGALMQWHVHGDLCFTDDPVAPRVAGVKPLGTSCSAPLVDATLAPMIHVWIIPHECGPFAALDGIAGGQVPEGETVLCDHAHGAP